MSDAKILIVEDERIVAKDIEKRLLKLGYGVTGIISSGEKALESVESAYPDLVLMDIRLKGKIDGIETAEGIRKKHDIPIVYITAYGSEEIVERARATEPFGYLLKPFEDRELRTAIEIALFRHNMELRLKESESRYRQLFEESRTALFVTDLKGNLTNVNRSFQDLFGYGKEDTTGTKDFFIDRVELRRLTRELEEKNTIIDYETQLLKKGGAVVDCLMSLWKLFDKEGRPYSYQGSIHDIRRRRELEMELSQAKKMEAIGTFAGTVADDVNNFITTIAGYAALLERHLQQNDLKHYMESIIKSCTMASNLAKDLLSFSRDNKMDLKKVNINDMLKNIESVFFPISGDAVTMEIISNDKDLDVCADQGQLERVFMNLISNARDALPDGGRITVSVVKTKSYAGSAAGNETDEWVLISVEDTGIGMDKGTVERIFEPFFTTKGMGKGTGLGLAIVYGIIEQHKGHIDVLSEPGKGTVFRIRLPIAGGDAVTGR